MIAKELGQSWSEVANMTAIERIWLLDRLARYYQERADAIKAESGSGTGRLTIED